MTSSTAAASASGRPSGVNARREEYHRDLKSLTKAQLLEVLERQKKLVANRYALERLPDKGEKIRSYLHKVEVELEQREQVGELRDALSGLTLKELNRWEWTAERRPDDDEERGGAAPESGEEPDPYAVNLYKLDKSHPPQREKFCPYKSQSSLKPKSPGQPDAAGDVCVFGLEDSLKVMVAQSEQFREVHQQHAATRLREKTFAIGDYRPAPGSSTLSYREEVETESEDEGDVVIHLDLNQVD